MAGMGPARRCLRADGRVDVGGSWFTDDEVAMLEGFRSMVGVAATGTESIGDVRGKVPGVRRVCRSVEGCENRRVARDRL